jgi:putative hydrolase of the HAD superfamily
MDGHMPQRIDTVFLDAGSVIIYPNWARVSDILAAHGVHVSAEALRRGEPAAKFSIDVADVIRRSDDAQRGWTYMHRVLENAGVPRSAAVDAALDEIGAYHTTHNIWEHVPEAVRPALERLRATGRRMVVVSNANGLIARLFDRLDLRRYFDVICDSCVEGVEKPDPRFFRIALDRAGAQPDTTIHVGDLYHVDVAGARAAGIRPLLLDPHDLYAEYDVERVRTLDELVTRLS